MGSRKVCKFSLEEMNRQIKLSDLSVGDWIKVGGEPARVLQLGIAGRNKAKGLSGQIYGFLATTEIEPISIPITRKSYSITVL